MTKSVEILPPSQIDKFIPPATDKSFNQYITVLKSLKKTVGENLFIIGGLLNEVREKKLYAEQYETFNEFLGGPEISFHRATAYKAMKIFEVYYQVYKVAQHDISDIDQDKLYLMADLVKDNPGKAEELLEEARTLSRSDLREKYGKAAPKEKQLPLSTRIKEFFKAKSIPVKHQQWLKQYLEEWELFKGEK